jgi:hypothetical protein
VVSDFVIPKEVNMKILSKRIPGLHWLNQDKNLFLSHSSLKMHSSAAAAEQFCFTKFPRIHLCLAFFFTILVLCVSSTWLKVTAGDSVLHPYFRKNFF